MACSHGHSGALFLDVGVDPSGQPLIRRRATALPSLH